MTNALPAIFTTLQFANASPEIVTNVLTMVCIFLPLSAIWAGVANESNIAYNGPDSHQRLIRAEFYRESASTIISQGSTACDKSRQMSVSTYTKSKDIESAAGTPTSPAYDKSISGNGIRVDHDFGFSRGDIADRV
jgi:pheromone alpha factor receptor